MRMLLLPLLIAAGLPALAAPEPALPRARPASGPVEIAPLVPLPRPRPEPVAADAPAESEEPEEAGEAEAEDADAPEAEAAPAPPPRDYQTACPAVLAGAVEAEALPPIRDGQCFAASPLALSAVVVNGRTLALPEGVVTDCGMATALPGWLATVDSWLAARENTRIAEVLVGTSYMCRNVNNAATGNLSFHGFAAALDISGFRLADGRTVTLAADWGAPGPAGADTGRILRFAHEAACASFTTVLGPEANALHRDHLHLDLGCHGRSCTARICE